MRSVPYCLWNYLSTWQSFRPQIPHKQLGIKFEKVYETIYHVAKDSNNKDIEKLSSGVTVVKYPVAGEINEELDLNDRNNLLRYEIHSIDKENEIAGLRMPVTDISKSSKEPYPLWSTLILKSTNEFVSDNIWWYESK